MAAASETDQGWAVWARVSPAPGHVLNLLHARMAEPFAPHVHDGFSIGACIEGLEMIRYRDRRHYAAPGGDGQRPGWPRPTAEVVECEVAVSRRGWVLFAIMCVVWGIPYLLIKVAVGSVSVPMVVFARTALGALVLLPLALRSGQLGALRHAWRPLVAFAALEMIVPWGLLSNAERQLPSSLAGLLIASVPIIGVVIARLTGGTERLSLRRWAGLLVGLAGVAVLAAQHLAGGHGWPIAEVLLVAIGYATAPLIAARKLADVPALPMTTACLSLAALVYTPAAILTWPHHLPSGQVLAALAALGVICTACAFIVFLQLLREVGPSRAMVFTYINPAVAVAAGVLLLSEPFTVTIAAAFVLILTGCALATGGRGHDRSGDGSSGNRGQPDQDRHATAPSAAGNPDQAPAGQP